MANPALAITQNCGSVPDSRYLAVISARVITPIVFCRSDVPCANATMDADTDWPCRNQRAPGSASARRIITYRKNVANPAARAATTGATTAGRMILLMITDMFTPDQPAPI